MGCDDGAPSPDAQRDAQEARFRPSPAKAAVWAGPFDALWGGQRASGRWPLRHAAAAPTRQEFEFGKNKGEFGSPYYPLEQTRYKLRYLNTVRTLTNPD